ncbi:baseplate J/gp47 family protein [Shinella sp.]|jgi:phage-related baseplate assembly protein|uniref:baseplate J/gp47 family protein n=1 Tax=Shinella sp. TaxID=1870904 RepID=UPI003F7215C8
MTLVVAETLDLSRLPAPQLIPIDFETDRLARMAVLVQLFDEVGIPYEVSKLHANPGAIHQRLDNNREMLVKIAINDTYKKTLIAFAEKASLDWWGVSFLGVERMAGENDARYKVRLFLEFENKSGGRLTGYKAEALKASIDVSDVGAWVDRTDPRQPVIRLAIMVASAAAWVSDPAAANGQTRLIRAGGGGNGAASSALVTAVQSHIDQEHIKQGTDVVVVQSVVVTETPVAYLLYHRRGPDPTLLRSASAKAVASMVDERHTPGRDLPRSSITAAGSVGGVERLEGVLPAGDNLVIANGGLAYISSITVESAYTDG